MYKEKLDQFFEEHRQEMVDDICEMIKIPSVVTEASEKFPYGENAAKAIDKFQEIAKKLGFDTKNVDYYAAFASFGDQPRGVDILAHLDVVPAADDWTVTEPYIPLVKDGNIYGRGAMDDKGPLIAALYAVYALKSLGVPLKKGIRVVAGSNEENGGREDLQYYLDREGEAEITLSPDGDYPIINVEKGKLRGKTVAGFQKTEELPRIISVSGGSKRYVIPGKAEAVIKGMSEEALQPYIRNAEEKNGIRISITEKKGDEIALTAEGKETHVGAPEEGNNGLTGMIDFLCSLPLAACEGLERLKGLNRVFPHGDYQGNAIGIARNTEDSGELFSVYNIMEYGEDHLTGSFDCKLPKGCTEENTRDKMLEALKKEKIDVENCEFEEAMYTPLDGELVQTALKCYQEYTGKETYGITISGNTYVNILKNQSATFGCMMPGTDYHIHFGNEFAPVEELVLSAKIYAKTLIELCS